MCLGAHRVHLRTLFYLNISHGWCYSYSIMVSQALAMHPSTQTADTSSSGGQIALLVILLIVILFFLIRWSLKKYFIDKKNSNEK